MQETSELWVRSLGWEDLLQKGMATHSSILAWRIPTDRGAWQAAVHGVEKNRTQLKRLSMWAHTQVLINTLIYLNNGLPLWLSVKNPPALWVLDSVPGLGRLPWLVSSGGLHVLFPPEL